MPSWAIYGNERRGGIHVSGAAPDSAAYTNFIARTTGLDATHTNAYKALLDGLTTDGIFEADGTSNYLDVLYVFATQDSTTALLNLVENAFNATVGSDPTFTADSDYFADDSDDTLTMGYNPSTAGGNFTQNSAHVSVWNLTNSTSDKTIIGNGLTSAGLTHFYIKHTSDNNLYARINDDGFAGGVAVADPRGLLMANRSSSTAIQHYQNGAALGGGVTQASASPLNANFAVLGGTEDSSDTVHHIAAMSWGASMDATKADQFYDRLRTYMTAVGVP
jgi:hypothetical protein